MKNLGYISFSLYGGPVQAHRVIEIVPFSRDFRLACGLTFHPAPDHVPTVTPGPAHEQCPGCNKPL